MNINFITDDDYKKLYDYQLGLCELCNKRPKKLFIDYNRKNGKVRGLLCRKCFYGSFSKSKGFLMKVSNYLLDPVANRVFNPND
jgi:hypothetical protein